MPIEMASAPTLECNVPQSACLRLLLRARTHAILQKPFDLETLVHVVERYCSRAPVPAQADAASPC